MGYLVFTTARTHATQEGVCGELESVAELGDTVSCNIGDDECDFDLVLPGDPL